MIGRIAAIMMATTLAGQAVAQTDESVAAYKDWSVFTPADPKECYIVSPPVSSEASRNNQKVDVNRSEIRLFVIIRPDADPAKAIDQQVAFTGGYPFRNGSSVSVQIGTDSYSFVTGSGDNDEYAWPTSADADKQVVASMRRGANAKITGVSSRGTQTVDTFSLLGFSAALDEAQRLCN